MKSRMVRGLSRGGCLLVLMSLMVACASSPNKKVVTLDAMHVESVEVDGQRSVEIMDPQVLFDEAGKAFQASDYETAARLFDERISINPATDISRGFLAAALGHLDRAAEARKVWEELLEINPNYSLQEHVDRLPFKDPADAESFVDGARKADLSSQ